MAIGVLSSGSSGAAVATWDEAMQAAASGMVARYWFDEASGAVVDQVGTLDLTVTGTVTRSVVDPWGDASAMTFAASARAEASVIGPLPVGAADRTLVALYRMGPTLSTNQRLAWYGNAFAARAVCGWNLGAAGEQIGCWLSSDDLNVTLGAEDGDWHVAVFRLSTARKLLLGFDGRYDARRLGADAATSAVSSLLTVAWANNTVPLTIGDLAIWDRALTRGELDSFWLALQAVRQ